ALVAAPYTARHSVQFRTEPSIISTTVNLLPCSLASGVHQSSYDLVGPLLSRRGTGGRRSTFPQGWTLAPPGPAPNSPSHAVRWPMLMSQSASEDLSVWGHIADY